MRVSGGLFAVGIAIGVALWVATDQVVWLALGVAIGAALAYRSMPKSD